MTSASHPRPVHRIWNLSLILFRFLSLLLLAVVTPGLSSPARAGEATAPLQRFEFEKPEMGMPFRFVLYARDQAAADAAAGAAFQRIEELNAIMSDYEQDSELCSLSRTSGLGRSVPVSDDLWFVLDRARRLSARSDGAFDVTVGPCVILWRKARRDHKLPDAARLAQARKAVGYRLMVLDPRHRTVRLKAPGMRLDLGGIAKGYAVDEALRVLGRNGITSALVAGAGDLAVSDPPPDKSGWRIELAPLDVTNAPPAKFVLLSHAAIATSGDLFQRLEIDGKRYSHIVDPRTGIGLTDHSLVSIIAKDCITADSHTKVVSVLGPKRGMRFIERTKGIEARVVRKVADTIEMRESPGLNRYYDKNQD